MVLKHLSKIDTSVKNNITELTAIVYKLRNHLTSVSLAYTLLIHFAAKLLGSYEPKIMKTRDYIK